MQPGKNAGKKPVSIPTSQSMKLKACYHLPNAQNGKAAAEQHNLLILRVISERSTQEQLHMTPCNLVNPSFAVCVNDNSLHGHLPLGMV
eukprot:1159526-Pelagomonas_calceolata.AAC.1